MTGPEPPEAAWSALLDVMELEADEVERMLRSRDVLEISAMSPAALTPPPPGLGPLPTALTDRAERLVQRQLDLSRELSIAMAGNRQQARLVSRLDRESDRSVPVFMDNRT